MLAVAGYISLVIACGCIAGSEAVGLLLERRPSSCTQCRPAHYAVAELLATCTASQREWGTIRLTGAASCRPPVLYPRFVGFRNFLIFDKFELRNPGCRPICEFATKHGALLQVSLKQLLPYSTKR